MKTDYAIALGELRPDALHILKIADQWEADSDTPEQADAMRRALSTLAEDLTYKAADLAAKRDALEGAK